MAAGFARAAQRLRRSRERCGEARASRTHDSTPRAAQYTARGVSLPVEKIFTISRMKGKHRAIFSHSRALLVRFCAML